MRMLAYARVSTEEQALSGLSLDAQEAQLRDEADRRGWTLLEVIRDEGISAKSLDRPGLRRALEQLAAGKADGLVVTKLDRLSRSIIDFCLLVDWFEEADAALAVLDMQVDTSTPGGRMQARMMVLFAEWEREAAGERTRVALAALRAQGKRTGREAVADRPELATRIRAMRDEEELTLQQIADRLNAEGVPTARGALIWRRQAVHNAAGYQRRRARRKPAALPAIPSKRTRPVR